MNDLGTKTIETQRLMLRKFTLDDAKTVYNNWASDEEVTKYLTWPTHSNIEVTQRVLKNWIDEYKDHKNYQWCIELKENNEAIGSIAVVNLKEDISSVEIGYCISRKYWNQGITTEALCSLIKFFFEDVKVNRLAARHDINNDNSGKVMKKCGLKYEGTQIKADIFFLDGCSRGLL